MTFARKRHKASAPSLLQVNSSQDWSHESWGCSVQQPGSYWDSLQYCHLWGVEPTQRWKPVIRPNLLARPPGPPELEQVWHFNYLALSWVSGKWICKQCQILQEVMLSAEYLNMIIVQNKPIRLLETCWCVDSLKHFTCQNMKYGR